MARRYWTPAEEQLLRERYPDTPTSELCALLNRKAADVYAKAQDLGVSKSEAFLTGPNSGRKRAGCAPNAGTFKPGLIPWNKGTHFCAGGRSAETRFRPGEKPQTWVPIGTVAKSGDGYWKRKVRGDAPRGMSRRNWVWLHIECWEQHHGAVPPNHLVAFKNGNRDDIRIENLELVSRRDWIKRHTLHNLPKEIVQVIQLKGALQRQVNKRAKA